MGEKRTVLVIGGPTASGKSSLAAAVARAAGGVIINADSLQLYDGLPLLTAQPSAEDLEKAPHRLYACLPPSDSCSAAKWRDMALREIENALAEGKLPILTGGTGFYLKTLIHGMSPIPDVSPAIRAKAAALQKELGNPGFHAALAARDPVTAAKLDPLNTQRLVRAWEVLEATGKSLASWQEAPPVPPPAHLRFVTVFLLPPREKLYRQCDERFTKMMAQDACAEVAAFRKRHGDASPLAKALGYPELSLHLDGKIPLEEAVTRAQASTRHYAKRQVTWFRHQMTADRVLEEIQAKEVLNLL